MREFVALGYIIDVRIVFRCGGGEKDVAVFGSKPANVSERQLFKRNSVEEVALQIIDGVFYIKTDENLVVGEYYDVIVTDADDYDLIGELV